MKQVANDSIHFLRTTAIGGLLFLLPLIVVGALIGQVVPLVLTIANALGDVLPDFIKTAGGITLLVILAIIILLILCFGAGLLAQRSWGKRLSQAFEKNLLLLFPRYAILKDQMADSIGGDQAKTQMKPVLVRFGESIRIGFETERREDAGLVTVYLPGSPDAWAGRVVLVSADRVDPLNANFGEAVASCEQLGRGSADLIKKSTAAHGG
jgi:uncharacterized membrane protein